LSPARSLFADDHSNVSAISGSLQRARASVTGGDFEAAAAAAAAEMAPARM